MKKSIKKKTEFHKRMLDVSRCSYGGFHTVSLYHMQRQLGSFQSKKTYENKSREAENAREQLNAAQSAQYSNPKDVEKLESKCSKSYRNPYGIRYNVFPTSVVNYIIMYSIQYVEFMGKFHNLLLLFSVAKSNYSMTS